MKTYSFLFKGRWRSIDATDILKAMTIFVVAYPTLGDLDTLVIAEMK